MTDPKAGGRAARYQTSMALGPKDPRARRGAQSGTTGLDLAPPLGLDRQGRQALQVDERSPLETTPNGKLAVRVGEGLEITPGSPHSIRAKRSRSIRVDRDGKLIARPTLSEVENDSNVAGRNARETMEAAELKANKNQPNGYAGLDSAAKIPSARGGSPTTVATLDGFAQVPGGQLGSGYGGAGTKVLVDTTPPSWGPTPFSSLSGQPFGAFMMGLESGDSDPLMFVGPGMPGAQGPQGPAGPPAMLLLDAPEEDWPAPHRSSLPAGRKLGRPTYITSGTSFTTGPTTTLIFLRMVGGGGGGGADVTAANAAGASGGACGGYAEKTFAVEPNTTYTLAIGAAGAGGAAGNNAGSAGGSTTFTVGATTVTCPGGNGGAGCPASAVPLAIVGPTGGSPTDGDVNCPGAPGIGGLVLSATVAKSGEGGSGPFGDGGRCVVVEGVGRPARGFGAGGSGAVCLGTTARAGGTGTAGLIIVDEYSGTY